MTVITCSLLGKCVFWGGFFSNDLHKSKSGDSNREKVSETSINMSRAFSSSDLIQIWKGVFSYISFISRSDFVKGL